MYIHIWSQEKDTQFSTYILSYIYIYLEWIYIVDIYPCITTNILRHMVLYPSNTSVYIYILVGGLEHDFYFPI